MLITNKGLAPHPSDAPEYYSGGDALHRSSSTMPRRAVLSTTTRTVNIQDSSAGEGLRRSVLMRNALTRSIAVRQAAERAAAEEELPAYETYQVSTRDYDEDSDEEEEEMYAAGASLVMPLGGGATTGVDAEEQWFDALLGEVSSMDIKADNVDVAAQSSSYTSSSPLDESDDEDDLESLAESRHAHRLAVARRRSSSSSIISSSSSISSVPGLVDDSDEEYSDDDLASSSSSVASCESPPPLTPTDAPLAPPTWNAKEPQPLPQDLDIGPPALT